MKSANLTGKQFTNLTVLERVDNYKAPDGTTRAMWRCRCRCGKEVIASTGDLNSGKTKSCGCYKNSLQDRRIKVKVGDVYERLTVIERADNTIDGHSRWRCKCQCGNETIVLGKALTRGTTQSCGCYNKDIISERSLHDLTGQKFGMLTVLKRAENGGKRNSVRWLCKCDCGRETVVFASALAHEGHTRSCGCMKSSFYEKDIEEWLCSHGVKYEKEYSFDDLLSPSGNKLRFDFAFKSNENLLALLEFQGEQHFIVAPGGFGKLQREITDAKKRDYCRSHNIPLYTIRFDENIPESLSAIISKIYSHDNSVPSVE